MAVGDEWEQSKLNPQVNRQPSILEQKEQELKINRTGETGKKNPIISAFEKIFNSMEKGFKESTQPIWERDSTVEIKEAAEQGFKESTQPIWERDSTVEIVGPDGADKIKKTLDPTEWVDIPDIIPDIVPDEAKDTIKKYLPIAALGAGALFLLSTLK